MSIAKVKHVDLLESRYLTTSDAGEPGLVELAARLHREQSAAMIAALRARGFGDVTPAFSAVLPLIGRDGTRQSDMAQQAGVTKQAVGQLVKELAARGYVELRRDPKDVRATLVTFTPRGLDLRRSGFKIKAAMRKDAAALLGEALLAKLEAALRKLLEHADARC